MIAWLQRLLVTFVTLALLAAPCATVFGPFGVGTAHAHGAVHSGGASHHHDASGTHDTAGHNALSPAKPAKGKHAACCCECNGWIVQKAADQTAPASHLRVPDASKQLVAGYPFAIIQATGPPERRSHSPNKSYDVLRLASAPLYAASGRLRL